MKKIIITTLALALCVTFSIRPAAAGSKEKHLTEGIIIGTSAAILGAAIVHEIHDQDRKNHARPYPYKEPEKHLKPHPQAHVPSWGWPRHPGVAAKPRYAYPHYPHHWHKGPCNIAKVWIEPQYEQRWRPGYMDRYGNWIRPSWESVLVAPGYWQTQNICRR